MLLYFIESFDDVQASSSNRSQEFFLMGAQQSIVAAAGDDDIRRVRHLLQKEGKSALAVRGSSGWTPLHKAARCGRIDMVNFLIQQKAVCFRFE